MLELGILKTFDSETHKAGMQLVGSLTTYLDNISVSVSIPSSAMVVGNYVLVAIPGGNPRDACIVASWPQGSSGGGGGSKIQDADGDTYLWVEKTADEDKIHGVVKGVEAFLIHDDGILDYPKQSSAKMDAGTTAQSIPNASWTKVNYVTAVWDVQSEINLTTDRIVVKKAGVYLVITQAAIYSMPDQSLLIAAIRADGADIGSARNIASGVQALMPLAVTICNLSASSYIEGYVYQNSGSEKTLGQYAGQNFVIAHKIS